MNNTVKYRRPLNSEQIELLELLYKFRFGSNNLVAEYLGKSSRGQVFNRLKVLEEQDFIGKRYDSSYKLQGKSAAYYLTATGARKIQDTRDADEEPINIKAIYKNHTLSEDFIAHCLHIFALYNQLKAQHGDALDYFTKPDLQAYEHFPKPLPDAFVSFEAENETTHYFVEILEDSQPFFTVVRKVQSYFVYKDSGNWAITNADFPTILFVCESASLQKRVQKQIEKSMRKRWEDDVTFSATLLANPELPGASE